MADRDVQLGDIEAAGLRKLPDQRLDEFEYDGPGTVYDDLFIELQIRPESCQEFLRKNLRPYRNKSRNQKLLAKGDPESLMKLSDSFTTAFGNLVWAKDRGWLLRPDELAEGDEPLQYVPPSRRREGDHEKFFNVLERLWKHMRNIIYEVKRGYLSPNGVNIVDLDDAAINNSSCQSSSEASPVPSDEEIALQHNPTPFTTPLNPAIKTMPPKTKRKKKTKNQPQPQTVDRTLPRLGAPPPPPNEVAPPGYWPASRTQEAIINIILDLHTTRMNSHPTVFTQAYEENMARLAEWVEEDRRAGLASESDDDVTVTVTRGADGQQSGGGQPQPGNDGTKAATTMSDVTNAPSGDGDAIMTEACPRPSSFPLTQPAAVTATNPISFTDAHHPHRRPPPSPPHYHPPARPINLPSPHPSHHPYPPYNPLPYRVLPLPHSALPLAHRPRPSLLLPVLPRRRPPARKCPRCHGERGINRRADVWMERLLAGCEG